MGGLYFFWWFFMRGGRRAAERFFFMRVLFGLLIVAYGAGAPGGEGFAPPGASPFFAPAQKRNQKMRRRAAALRTRLGRGCGIGTIFGRAGITV